MKKPQNYDNVKVGGYIPPMVGGHHIIIKQVTETQSKAGKDMIVVLFDFDKNDVQPGFFTKEFKDDVRPDKKWPHAGTAYILCEDQKSGDCSKKLKSFITAFEKSNNCDAVWGDKFAGQFKNKKIGGVFGEVENEYNGKITMRHELRWFCETDRVDGATVPDPVLLNREPAATNQKADDGFMNIPDGGEEEIPWG